MAEWIISSSALILAVVLLRRVLRGRLSPRLQYALWALVLVRLLVPVSFGAAGLSVQNLVRGADERAAERVVTYVSNAAPDLSVPEPVTGLSEPGQQLQYNQEPSAPEHEPDAAEPEARAETGTPVTVSDILRYAWYAGMAVLALWFLSTNIAFRARLTRSARRMEYPGCKLPLYVSGAVETPCLFGVIRPAVYLTPGAAADPVTLTHSVEHELTHFRHGDHVWALLRCLCLVLHWYNPLVWLAAALSRRDAELACDEATIRRLGEAERAAYGRTLIGITCGSRPSLLRTATTMNFGKSGLKERISLIVKRPKTAAWALVILLLAAVFVTGCTFTGAQAAEPELEGFIAENTGLTAGEGQYLAASYELLLEENDTYYVNCCVTVFELAEDRTLTMAENVLTPMSLTLKRFGGGWTQEAFWMPEDGDYNDPELEERFPQAARERLNELSSRGSLPLAMRCFEKAVPALDADVAAAIEPYLSELVESGTTVEDASSTRNMAYAMIAFYGSCAVEYMQEQLAQPDLSEERRLILTEAIAYVEEMRELDRTEAQDTDPVTPSDIAVNSPQTEYTPEPWPEFVAGPAEGGYEFCSEELGLSFTVPAEVSQKVAVASGVKYRDPDGTSITLYYVPENGRYPITMFYMVAESPRGDFFRPGNWYYSTTTGHPIAAMSESSVYFTMGPLGGSEIGRDDPLWDDYIETCEAVSTAIRESIAVDEPSSIPALDTDAVIDASVRLAARGDAALTRAEAAQLAFDLLSAENKSEAYPLDYTDVEPGSEAAQAISYLESYGLLTRYSRDGEDLDDGLFRPDEDISRAEFATLLHRLSFQPCPLAYGEVLENVGIDYWACSYVDYAWKCGWLELSDGDIRADELITCAEAARALMCVAADGYPTPSLENQEIGQIPVLISLASDDLTASLGELPEYGPSEEEYAWKLLLMAKETLRDFKFVSLEPTLDEFIPSAVLCEYSELGMGTPLILYATFSGTFSWFGLSFTDEDGKEWQLTINADWSSDEGGVSLNTYYMQDWE